MSDAILTKQKEYAITSTSVPPPALHHTTCTPPSSPHKPRQNYKTCDGVWVIILYFPSSNYSSHPLLPPTSSNWRSLLPGQEQARYKTLRCCYSPYISFLHISLFLYFPSSNSLLVIPQQLLHTSITLPLVPGREHQPTSPKELFTFVIFHQHDLQALFSSPAAMTFLAVPHPKEQRTQAEQFEPFTFPPHHTRAGECACCAVLACNTHSASAAQRQNDNTVITLLTLHKIYRLLKGSTRVISKGIYIYLYMYMFYVVCGRVLKLKTTAYNSYSAYR